jgi:predicted Zn-dependent protease
MPDFFETLGRRNTLSSPTQYIPALLQSHPVTSDRIAESRERAGQYPRTKQPESLSYAFARERVRVIAAPPDADLRPYYLGRHQNRALTPAERYGEALAEAQAGDRTTAENTLRELGRKYPTLPLIESSLGQTQADAGRSDEALATLANAVAVSPRNVPLSVRYAEALMRAGRNAQAHDLLLDLFNNVPPTPSQIRLIALAASAAGNTGDAYYYMSEYHISSGDFPLAVNQLELALAAPDITPVQRARYAARMKEIREALQQNARRGPRAESETGKLAP